MEIPSGDGRRLKAVYQAIPNPQAGIVILHGIADRLFYWAAAQQLVA